MLRTKLLVPPTEANSLGAPPKPQWIRRFSSLAGRNSHCSQPCVDSRHHCLRPLRRFSAWAGYSVEYSGIFCRSLELTVCAAISSAALWSASLPQSPQTQIFVLDSRGPVGPLWIPAPWAMAWKLSQGSKIESQRAHFICFPSFLKIFFCCSVLGWSCFLVVSDRRVNLVPVTPSWSAAEVYLCSFLKSFSSLLFHLDASSSLTFSSAFSNVLFNSIP